MKTFFVRLLKAINVVFALLLAFSYLGAYTNPQHITLPAFGGLAYVYLLIVNVLFAALWLFIRPKLVLISLVVIALGWKHLEYLFQWNFTEETDNKEEVRVMSYNVRMFNYYNWDGQGRTTPHIRRLIKREGSDIVCMQEFYTNTLHRKEMINDFRMGQNLVFTHVRETARNKNNSIALATFSSYPVVKRGHIDFRNSSNGCIYTDLKIREDTVRVYNCHLQSVRLGTKISDYLQNIDEEGYKGKQVQTIIRKLNKAYRIRALQIDDLMDHIAATSYPVILCGDTNDTPFSYTYQRLTEQLQDAFMQAGKGFGTTYRSHILPLRIDYIFHTAHYQTNAFAVNKNVSYSDHYPVTVTLSRDTIKTEGD